LSDEAQSKRRPIRSYVLRQGRLTHGQSRAMKELWPTYGLEPESAGQSDQWFERTADLVLEIGFGNGRALVECAAKDPLRNYLGVEVHTPGVGQLLLGIEEHELQNLRVFNHDAVEVLQKNIADAALSEIRIWFPDPWHKKKHNKRRLVQTPLVALLVDRLKSGGLLHLATDWVPYSEWMTEVLATEPRLRNLSAPQLYCGRPQSRPETHFEQRGERLGHEVRDLLYQKT